MTLGAITPSGTVASAIERASARTGVDFSYLLATAKAESGLDATAQAATSSARGLFQFTRATWLETVGRHGAAHGLGWAAAAVRDGSAARDPAVRAAILDLRADPAAAAAMAAAYAADNGRKLEVGLGHAASATDLYMAHFLGSAGALRFLRARDADPQAEAAGIAPAAARANHAVFFAQDGAARSLGAVYDRFAAGFGGSPAAATGTNLPLDRPPHLPVVAVSGAAPDAARLAYLLLAELSA